MQAALDEESGPLAKKAQRYFSARFRVPAGQKHLGGFVKNFTFGVRKRQPTPVFLPGKSHGPRSPVGYSPWRCKESDTTEQLHFHFHFLRHLALS